MPLHKGHSREVISKNIKEMVAAGHEPKQAVAAALANARKYKKMAEGGMVDPDDDEGLGTNNDEEAQRSLGEIQKQGNYNPQDVENPELEEHDDHLAKALYKMAQGNHEMHYADGGEVQGSKVFSGTPEEQEAKRQAWKDRWASLNKGVNGEQSPQQPQSGGMLSDIRKTLGFAEGGLVEGEEDGPLGTKPSMEFKAETEEPMSAEPMKPAAQEYHESELSEAAKAAIAERKKKRKFY